MATKRKRDPSAGPLPSSGNEGLQNFKKAVQELKTKSQSKITQINGLADSLHVYAQEVVQILVDEVEQAPVARLQPLILVVDCILKKVGKAYKAHLSERVYDIMRSASLKATGQITTFTFLQRMLNDSWRKHDLLPIPILDRVETLFAAPPPAVLPLPGVISAPALPVAAMRPEGSAHAASHVAPLQAKAIPGAGLVKQEQAGTQLPAAQVAQDAPPMKSAPPSKAVPPMKAPPPQPSAGPPLQVQTEALVGEYELVERRLGILTKIIERRSPAQDELQEIMKVPEVRAAIAMQHRGQRQEAMALLSKFKLDLEQKHNQSKARHDPRRRAQEEQPAPVAQTDARQADPRRAEVRPADPRQPDAQPAAAIPPVDPRRVESAPAPPKPVDPRKAGAPPPADAPIAAKRPAQEAAVADPRKARRADRADRAKAPKVQPKAPPAQAKDDAPVLIEDDEDEQEKEKAEEAERKERVEKEVAVERQMLRGASSIGFSEAWLRQFMEQLPTKGADPNKPSTVVGRRVLSASGEQMVYVDEMSPSEVLLLLQLVFLLEERLRKSGGALDVTQRIPHTFGYLQVEPAIDVMLKRFFDELPHQCTTTGLRFASREKLRRHHDALFRRRSINQQRTRGAEARGWMESIPEWVGNRDLVVGPALFRLGDAEDGKGPSGGESGGQAGRSGSAGGPAGEAGEAGGDGGLDEGEPRWLCPFDERRSICPISGEAFERTWSSALNDWAYADVVAVEPGSDEHLEFPTDVKHPQRLSETAVLFKRSCFFNTPSTKRLAALEECGSIHAPHLPDPAPAETAPGAPAPPAPPPPPPHPLDEELAKLMKSKRPPGVFF